MDCAEERAPIERKRYKIGRISDLMGISSESIRYYEREGIIKPQKVADSGYRTFSAWDLHVLIRTRMFRKYGYTLSETSEVFQEDDFDNVIDSYRRKQHELEEQIRHQNHVLEQLKYDKRTLLDAMQNMNKFRIVYSPAMVFVDVQRSYDIIDNKVSLYRKWIDRIPYAASGGMFDYPILPHGELRYGLMIAIRNVGKDILARIQEEGTGTLRGEEVYIPSQKCVTTYFVSGSDKELCLDMFQPTFDFMEKTGLKVSGTPFARMCHMYKNGENEYTSWYQGWVPFEGECDLADPEPCLQSPSPYLDLSR